MATLGPYERNTIVLEDALIGLRQLPDQSADLAIADPPYNLSKGGQWHWNSAADLPGFGGDWSKFMEEWDDLPLIEYLQFTIAWLRELKRVVKHTGSIWIHGSYHNIGLINFALQLLEIEIINEVVWYKRNSFPNLSGRRLTASHETLLWAHTGGNVRKYNFNYETAKAFADTSDLLKKSGKQMRTVWDVPNNKTRDEIRYGKHPAQKPVRLLRRMLQISARKGDLILSPFAGTGSDCIAAVEEGLSYLGFETNREYCKIAHHRLENLEALRSFETDESRVHSATKNQMPDLFLADPSLRS